MPVGWKRLDMKTKAIRNDGMKNCHMAEQDYHMDYAPKRQRETFGEDKPGLWSLTRALSKQHNVILLLLALRRFAPTSELVLLRLEPNMPSVSSTRAPN